MINIKKFILFFFCFLISETNVLALNDIYYSEYSSFSPWSDTYVNENDTTFVETERRYKWYKENINLGDYYIEKENNSEYPLIDRTDHRETVYSEWIPIKPENKLNRIVNSRTVYEYQDMKEIRYIHLSNLQGSYGSLRISEIEVYAGNNKVNYNYYCEGCNGNFDLYINNNNIIENMSYINNNGYIRLDLNNYYPLDSITIKLYLFDVGTETKRYSIKITRDSDINSNAYSKVDIASFFTYSNFSQIVPFTYGISTMSISNPEWYNPEKSFEPLVSSITRKVNVYQEYQYKDILYRYYNKERQYSVDYSKNVIGDYIIKDGEQYKDYYRFKKREKVEISNNLVINSNKAKLEDFIISTTTPILAIDSNINLNKNGIYEVNYIFPFTTITKEVEVSILDNIIKDFNNKIDVLTTETNSLKDQLNDKDVKINDLNDKNNALKNEMDNKIDILYDEANKLKSQIDKKDIEIINLIDKNNELENDMNDKNDKVINLVLENSKLITMLNNNKEQLSTIKVESLLNRYENIIQSSINLMNIEKTKFEKINNDTNYLKDNYILTLSNLNDKLDEKDINNYLIIIGFILILIIVLLFFILMKKMMN